MCVAQPGAGDTVSFSLPKHKELVSCGPLQATVTIVDNGVSKSEQADRNIESELRWIERQGAVGGSEFRRNFAIVLVTHDKGFAPAMRSLRDCGFPVGLITAGCPVRDENAPAELVVEREQVTHVAELSEWAHFVAVVPFLAAGNQQPTKRRRNNNNKQPMEAAAARYLEDQNGTTPSSVRSPSPNGKKRKPNNGSNSSSNNTADRTCQECDRLLSKWAFSKRQWFMQGGSSCKECIAKRTPATPVRAGETAGSPEAGHRRGRGRAGKSAAVRAQE